MFRFSSELQRVFNPVIPFPALNGQTNLALSELVKAKVGQLVKVVATASNGP